MPAGNEACELAWGRGLAQSLSLLRKDGCNASADHHVEQQPEQHAGPAVDREERLRIALGKLQHRGVSFTSADATR